MDEHDTRRSQRGAAGLAEATRGNFVRPDTVIVLKTEGGEKMLNLGRPAASGPSVNPAFHMYNASRRGSRKAKNGKPQQPRVLSAAAAAAAAMSDRPGAGLLQGPLGLLNRVPFMNLAITAALVHRVWSFVMRRLFDRNPQRQLVRRGDAGEEDDEEELDERAEDLLHRVQHASMLPTMLRNSLPPPKRKNLAKRAAEQHHSRPRDYRTAHQLMHGGSAAPGAATNKPISGRPGRRQAQRRPLGKLEKLDLLVRQQIRAAMIAEQRQQDQLLQQQLIQGGSEAAALSGAPGAMLALPPAAPAAGSGSGGPPNSSAERHQSSAVPLQQRQQVHGSQAQEGGQLALQGALMTGMLPPAPLAPPAFRPLPPDLRARMQGAPRPSAVASAPAARAAAAGPPLAPKASSADAGQSDSADGAVSKGKEPEACGSEATETRRKGGEGERVEAETDVAVSVPRVARVVRGKKR